jgi:hypothetical protein
MHLLIILALAIWLGVSLCKLSMRQSLALIRTIGIMALAIIGSLALLVFVGYQVNSTFAVYLGLALCGVGIIGGLAWLVVKLGKIINA